MNPERSLVVGDGARLTTGGSLSAHPIAWFPCIMYHRIVDCRDDSDPFGLCVTVRELRAQLNSLKRRGYRSADPETAVSGNGSVLNFKPVVITFDDGYLDFMTHALPVLQETGFSATVFLVSDRIGDRNAWDSPPAKPLKLMNASGIREAQSAGIRFGSHSRTHPRLAEIRYQDARSEVADSKSALEDLLGERVDLFCYPHGSWSRPVADLVREAGYSYAFGTEKLVHERYYLSRIDAARCWGSRTRWWLRTGGYVFSARSHVARIKSILRT